MTLSLTKLQECAEKATPWDINDREKASQAWIDNKENNAEFCRSMAPQVALALIRVARAAKQYATDDTMLFSEFEAALKEIEL